MSTEEDCATEKLISKRKNLAESTDYAVTVFLC